ncbi:hypothetical protein [Polaromonas sp.]|uniref:hypothetical protein n=1 Tax=Polaromonas sp. TaxID=1869339 RepID=UPI00345B01F2
MTGLRRPDGGGAGPAQQHSPRTGVGYHGVFSGRKWNTQIYPRVREMIDAGTGCS